MYHFIVTGSQDAWDDGVEEFPRSRFLEYTPPEIASLFEDLNSSHLEKLKKLPCLCAYEGHEDLWIGTIKDIELDKTVVRIFVDIDQDIGPIPNDQFTKAMKRFGVHNWEFSRTHWAIKNGDLFSKLRDAGLPTKLTLEPPTVTVEDVRQDEESSFIIVSSVKDFIEEVTKINSGYSECFYRGHSDETYRLMPSIFRTDGSGTPLYRDSEHAMFREILVSNSSDFREDNSTLDKLVRMQHYSLPTRLLDITANPLIALFFAVWSESKYDTRGEVITFHIKKNKVKYFDSDTASCLANLALLSAGERDEIIFFDPPIVNTEKSRIDHLRRFNEQLQIERLLHYIGSEKPYFKPRIRPDDLKSVICVKSKRSNDRITSQSGAFLLFGHDAVLSENGSHDIQLERIKIDNKENIRKELELLNITESTVFPYIENSARDIARRFKTKPPVELDTTDEPGM